MMQAIRGGAATARTQGFAARRPETIEAHDFMDDDRLKYPRIERILRQRLESLQRAGVEQLPRARRVDTSASPATGPPSQTTAARDNVTAVPSTPSPPDALAHPLKERETRLLPEDNMKKSAPSPLPLATRKAQLKSLCDEVRACERCPQLVANRTQTVFGVGDPRARLCFFGEAPGADEDRLGEPFVGRAGQLLDKILEACTLQRSDVYILNTVKCRPPGNRNPEPAEIDNCRPFFEQQLELIQPEFICCLGLVAAKALLDTKLSISKLRGELHPWRWAQVLVTYHPAYLLRNPSAKRDVWQDMQFLMKKMGIPL